MSLFASERMQRCQLFNSNQRLKLALRIQEIEQSQTSSIHGMDKRRLDLLQQLHTNRCESVKYAIRKTLNANPELNLSKRGGGATIESSNVKRPNVFERSKGFTKVSIDEDDIGKKPWQPQHSFKPSRTRMTASWDNDVPHSETKDSDIYVHYPTEEFMKESGGLITLEMLKAVNSGQDLKVPTNFLSKKTVFETQLPRYVLSFKKVAPQDFDQFTNSTMNLEERKILQRQRESIPPLVGHLPVRPRVMNDYLQRSNTMPVLNNKSKVSSRFPNINTTAGLSSNIHVYRSKKAKSDDQKSKDEQNRLRKLKLENEAIYYKAALERTSTFLGNASRFTRLVQQQKLDKEEQAMLAHLRQITDRSFEKEKTSLVSSRDTWDYDKSSVSA